MTEEEEERKQDLEVGFKRDEADLKTTFLVYSRGHVRGGETTVRAPEDFVSLLSWNIILL